MNSQLKGVLFGISAFTAWGLLPVYWKQLAAVNPFEILCHRIVWSCFFLVIIISWQRRWPEISAIRHNSSAMKRLVLSGLIIGFNWFIYIWAVNSGRVVETSLGYYINPMFNVLLGFLLLKERFVRLQWVAVCFALIGVAYSLISYGHLPLFALGLAISFALYGFSRKKIHAAPIPMLLMETIVLFIPALGYIIYQLAQNHTPFFKDAAVTAWCIGAGVVTSIPLVWFAAAVKRLNLSTIGILQYIGPSLAFVLGVFVYKEPFSRHSLITFSCIWVGVILYTRAALSASRSTRP
jgi:chloramphenicol-sensitive protein RarD